MEKKAKAVTESSVYLVVVAAVLVVANVLSFGVHKRIDMTKAERFTLSKGSGRLVSGLKRPITVKAYVTVGLAKLDAFVRDLDELMKEYERSGGGKFVYQKIVAKTDEEKNAAKDYGLKEAAFGEGSETGEDQASIAQGYMGLVFLYGDEKDVIPILQPDSTSGLEFWVSSKIREIAAKADDNAVHIGVVGGHDEIKLSDANLVANEQGGRGGPSIKQIADQAFPYFKFEDIDLKGGDTEIDDAVDALIITQPNKDWTDKELRRIDQFMMKENKGLVVYASAVNIKPSDGKMTATLSTHGLEKLLGGYGIEMKKDALLDWARSIRLPVPTQAGGMVFLREPAVVQVQAQGDDEHQLLDTSFAGFFRIDELAFPFPSTLVAHADKQPGAEVKVVARTTPAAWAETSDTVDLGMKADWKPKPPLDQHDIAIAVTGKLKPAMGSGDGIDVAAESKGANRILVVSSSQFLANPFARAGNGQPMEGQMAMMMPAIGGDKGLQMIAQPYAQKYLTSTLLAFRNTVDYLTGDLDLIATSAKILGETNLTYSDITKPKVDANDDDASLKAKDEQYRLQRKSVQSRVQWTLILIMPVLFAALGIANWQLRERRRLENPLGLSAIGKASMALTTEHKIYIGAGLLVLLGGGVYLSQQNQKADEKSHAAGASSANLPPVKLAAEDVDKVTKIEIKNEAKTDVVLEKRGDKWQVTKPVDYPANQANVKSLLDNLKELKTKEQVETTAASYADYNLDDGKGVHVQAWKGADSAVDLTFGKSGGRGQLARKGGVDGVFAVSGYSGYLYTREVKNWRDTEVLKFDDTTIAKIDLKNENGELHFKKDGDTWSASTAKDKLDRFDDAKAKDFLRAFKALSADDFADGKSDADLGLDKPAAVVTFTPKDGAPIEIDVGKQSNGESRYFKKAGNPQAFSMSSWAAGWAMAKAEKFQKADDKAKGAGGASGAGGAPAKKDDKKK